MPRIRIGVEPPLPANESLAQRLKKELKSGHDCGQPLVYERELRPDQLRVTVIWDEWDGMPLEKRTSVILRAYQLAEGESYRDKIALADGLTVPEATAAGMLTYQVNTALRKTDPVTVNQCRKAMLDEGASKLFGPNSLQLRFATVDEAEACRKRLIKRLPKSDNVWVINREFVVQEFVTGDQSVAVHES